MGSWRFRYYDGINHNKWDVSECVFCQGYKYGRREKEVLDVDICGFELRTRSDVYITKK